VQLNLPPPIAVHGTGAAATATPAASAVVATAAPTMATANRVGVFHERGFSFMLSLSSVKGVVRSRAPYGGAVPRSTNSRKLEMSGEVDAAISRTHSDVGEMLPTGELFTGFRPRVGLP
jgi:hypothetical protein